MVSLPLAGLPPSGRTARIAVVPWSPEPRRAAGFTARMATVPSEGTPGPREADGAAPGTSPAAASAPWSARCGGTAPQEAAPDGVPAGAWSGEPQETRWSGSPPKPPCREASACQAAADSGLAPCSRAGSSQLATGSPLWRTAGTAEPLGRLLLVEEDRAGLLDGGWGSPWSSGAESSGDGDAAAPGGGAGIASPSAGAGRLVPGTHAAPFQYRM